MELINGGELTTMYSALKANFLAMKIGLIKQESCTSYGTRTYTLLEKTGFLTDFFSISSGKKRIA